MIFKVSQHDCAPNPSGYWGATLMAEDGRRVRVFLPESYWSKWAWSIGTDVEVQIVDGEYDFSQISNNFSILPVAPQIEIDRIWGDIWVKTL